MKRIKAKNLWQSENKKKKIAQEQKESLQKTKIRKQQLLSPSRHVQNHSVRHKKKKNLSSTI